jgi:MoaA/NifB/PqqE/SkfB family radical SAM enzyme
VHTRVDIELTNRCNAKCDFCPRDQTPHQGLMTPEIFEKTLERAIEYRALVREILGADLSVSLCGLGEPLLNKFAPSAVQRVREEEFRVGMSSNGALLDERRGRALLDAGLQEIFLNVGDRDDDYEATYALPFERTRENVVRFLEMAGDECKVWMVLVDHRRDPAHQAEMKAYWQSFGFTLFQEFSVMNRGGALFVDHMQFESYPELASARELLSHGDKVPICAAPFAYLFVGYDGNHYLCCSDWKKEVPLGTVFDRSFRDVIGDKLRHVAVRQPICRTCNLDPINHLTEELRSVAQGEADASSIAPLVESMQQVNGEAYATLERLEPGVTAVVGEAPPPRRLIPVTAR